MTLREMFDAADDDFLRFERIENPRHPVPDICAFLMLHELSPNLGLTSGEPIDIIAAAEHDEIFLQTDCEALAKVATEEIVRDLSRCGVRYSSESDCLTMFV